MSGKLTTKEINTIRDFLDSCDNNLWMSQFDEVKFNKAVKVIRKYLPKRRTE